MRNFLLSLAFCLLGLNAIHAQSARFVHDEKDVFSGEHIMRTNSYWGAKPVVGYKTVFDNKTYIEYYVEITNDKPKLFVRLFKVYNFESGNGGGYHIMAVDSENNVATLHGDDVASIGNEKINTIGVHLGYGISTANTKKSIDITRTFPISKEVIEHPVTKDIQCIRLEISGVKYDYTLTKSDRKNIKKLFNLVATKL